jgi:putative redox protein
MVSNTSKTEHLSRNENALAPDVVAVESGRSAYHVDISAHDIHIAADEPVSAGGLGLGLTPFELLSAALAACTTITVRMFSNRRQWPLRSVRTEVKHSKTSDPIPQDQFVTMIRVEGPLNDRQIAELVAVANHCPVHLALERNSSIGTHIERADPTG